MIHGIVMFKGVSKILSKTAEKLNKVKKFLKQFILGSSYYADVAFMTVADADAPFGIAFSVTTK